MENKDNANPTILTTAQLPTRRSKKSTHAHQELESRFSQQVLSRPQYLSTPFCDVSWPDDGSSDDEFTEEPIDEQEIYGKPLLAHAAPRRLSVLFGFIDISQT